MVNFPDAGSKDPSMVGAPRYARAALDHYPTEQRCTDALLSVLGDDMAGMTAWEPFCGDGAISKVITPHVWDITNTDIVAYEGFDPDILLDFFSLTPESELPKSPEGLTPDAIITNPPYEKGMALKSVEQALALMQPQNGTVMMLLRKEFDSAKKHRHIFRDCPAFQAKVDLLFRPRWIKGSKGSPRHNYAWYVWSWAKANTAAGLKPELYYAGA